MSAISRSRAAGKHEKSPFAAALALSRASEPTILEAKPPPAKRRCSRWVIRSGISSRVEKASNTAPVGKVSRDKEYYETNPMDGEFILGDKCTRNRKYAKLWARSVRIFGTIAQQLEATGRLNTRDIDMNSLPNLVAAVTGGRYGLMQDLATFKQKLSVSDSDDARWSGERPVEELLEALDSVIADNTSLVAVDGRLMAEKRKDEKSEDIAVREAMTQQGPTTAPIRRIITTRAAARDLSANNSSLRQLRVG